MSPDDDIIDIGLRQMGVEAWQRVVDHINAGKRVLLDGRISSYPDPDGPT